MLKGLGPQEPPKPQYYRVACPEGHWLQGQRTDGYQALRCPTCGGGIFVLPRSPLPEPRSPAAKARSTRPRTAAPAFAEEGPIALSDPPVQSERDDGPEIEWEEPARGDSPPIAEVEIPEPEPESEPKSRPEPALQPPPRPAPPRPRPLPAAPAPAARKAARVVEVARTREQGEPEGSAAVVAEGGSFWEGVKRRRHMILAVAVATLVVSALGWNVRRQRLQTLPKVVEIGRTRGLDALDAGDFDEAKLLLTRAARAVDALGGKIEKGDEIRQGAFEAEIYADLVPERLEAILDEARAAPVDGWSEIFRSKYRGRTVVLDIHVTALPKEGRGYEVDYKVLSPGANPIVAHFDLAGFGLFERSKLKVKDRVIFGAKLESIDRDPDFNKGWRIVLQPASGVLLTRDAALAALGLSVSDAQDAGGAP